MKNLWQNSQSLESAKFVWMAAPRLDLMKNPDEAEKGEMNIVGEGNEEADILSFSGLNSYVEGAGNPVQLESDNVRSDVNLNLQSIGAGGGVAKERAGLDRTPGSTVGIGLGAKFERQYWNPIFQIVYRLFSKSSVLKNISQAKEYFFSALNNTQLPSSELERSCLSHTGEATMKSIAKGGGSSLKDTSLTTLNLLEPSVLGVFDQVKKDVETGKVKGKEALNKREGFRKVKEEWIPIPGLFTPGRETRHSSFSDSIGSHMSKAKGEVKSNIDLVRFELKKQTKDAVSGINGFREGIENGNLNDKKEAFWKFQKFIILDPEKFLSSPSATYFGINWKNEFKIDNPIRLVDAFNYVSSSTVIGFDQKSHQASLNMDETIANFESRDKASEKNLPEANFESLYQQLTATGLENSKNALGEKEMVKELRRALRRCKVSVDEIFPNANIELVPEEQMIYIVRYLNQNPKIIDDKRFSIPAKQQMLRWLYDKWSEMEAAFVSGGVEDESGTVFLRKFVLSNAESVRDASIRAVQSIDKIPKSIRSDDPMEFQENAASIKSFISLYDHFFEEAENEKGQFLKPNEDGKSLLDKLQGQEREAVRSLLLLKPLRDKMEGMIDPLVKEREEFDKEVVSTLSDPDEIQKLEKRAEIMEIRLAEELGKDKGWDPSSYKSMSEMHKVVMDRLFELRNSSYKKKGFNFKISLKGKDYEKLVKQVGSGIAHELKKLPEVDDVNIDTNRNDLMNQLFQTEISEKREKQFRTKLENTLAQQWSLFVGVSKKNEIVPLAPEGLQFSQLVVTDVTQTQGELDFPDALETKDVLKDLEVIRQQDDGSLVLQDTKGKKGFVMQQVEIDGEFRIHLSEWDRLPEQQGRNVNFKIPGTRPKRVHSVLNLFEGHAWKKNEETGKTTPLFEKGREIRMVP